MPKQREARLICYTGQVQGVGFRATAWQIARRYQVSGYVKNLADGRVELLAEGETSELTRFLSDLSRTMSAYITRWEESPVATAEEYHGFEIRQ